MALSRVHVDLPALAEAKKQGGLHTGNSLRKINPYIHIHTISFFPDSFQWCPATGQGAMGTNWSRGRSVWTGGRTSSLWGWWSTGTGCPGKLWSLPLWRYWRPTLRRYCAACCRWPCLGRRVGLDDPQRSLPNPNILWFCDSLTHLSPLSQTNTQVHSSTLFTSCTWTYANS